MRTAAVLVERISAQIGVPGRAFTSRERKEKSWSVLVARASPPIESIANLVLDLQKSLSANKKQCLYLRIDLFSAANQSKMLRNSAANLRRSILKFDTWQALIAQSI